MSNFNMTPNQPPAKCYSYVRFSTVSQGKEGKDSYIRQTLAAKEYAERKGLEYQDKSFSDLGISGFRSSKKRDGLSSMLEAIQSGAIEPTSTICIDGFDRLSRASFEHTYDTVRLIVGTGVKLHVDLLDVQVLFSEIKLVPIVCGTDGQRFKLTATTRKGTKIQNEMGISELLSIGYIRNLIQVSYQ
ncbi:recombinase family protein [Vibrio vulnificus]|nr:recombinase family protein [Vibrio vulnificus]MCU8394625.1 recombinase family protein [Vibrio vulnificus]MCU8538174.1 recombinase family protein [Vibrio vulnificus]MCU8543538.1 recombinase family protein [Vibrio vulnificus]